MPPKPSVLVLRQDLPQRPGVWESLAEAGYEVLRAQRPDEGLEMLEAGQFDVVVCDLCLPRIDALELVGDIRRLRPLQVVVVMTPRGEVDRALEAMRRGAFHYITQPVTREELLITVQRAAERARLLRENRLLQVELERQYSVEGIVGRHGGMEEVLRLIRKVAPTATTVMVYGESGTGKELVARAIHQGSPRAGRPMYAVNCAALPEVDLAELERHLLTRAMEKSDWVIARAAPLLGLTYRTLQYRLGKHGIGRPKGGR